MMVVGRIRVLVVDDQQRARQSLTALLMTDPYVREVYQAPDGSQALGVIEQSAPDLILMDARMPEMDGAQATREIKQRWPEIKVFVLSMYVEYRNEALTAGADAFVSKGGSPDHLLALIHDVASASWRAD
jgi:DNA-binding NarL/FixJ family response regulator